MEKLHANYPVGALAEALDVSRSGFYSHLHKPARPRRVISVELLHHRETFPGTWTEQMPKAFFKISRCSRR